MPHTTHAACQACGRPIDPERYANAKSCGPSCRARASERRRREALRLFLAGSKLRASGDFDPEQAAALDREAARLLGVAL